MTDVENRSSDADVDQPALWQQHWHRILDAHAQDEDDVDSNDEVLPDPSDDARLHTPFWLIGGAAQAPARAQAMHIMPAGNLMLARLEAHLSTPHMAIDVDQAKVLLRLALTRVRQLNLDAPDADSPIRVMDESMVPLLAAFAQADNPFVNFRDALGDMAEQHSGTIGMRAFHFLSEPLYQLAASYEVADWIRWPLCASADADDPTLAIYQLATGGWSPGWDDQGVFLFDRRRELKPRPAA